MNKALRVPMMRQIVVILLLSGLCQQVVAGYIGKIVKVDGDKIIIQNTSGASTTSGDRMQITSDLAGEVLLAGTSEVVSVQGNYIIARVIDSKMQVQTGMLVQILPPSTSLSSSDAPASDSEELFWLKPDYQPGQRHKPESSQKDVDVVDKQTSSRKNEEVQIALASGRPLIESITTNQYQRVWTDAGSGANKDFASFRPIGPAGFYPLGDVSITEPWQRGRYAAPAVNSLIVRDGALPLQRPVTYRMTWSSRGSGSDIPFSTWEAIAAPGYQCLGEVGVASLDTMPSTNAIRCIPQQCVEQVTLRDRIWKDSGSGANQDYSAWAVPGMTTYIGYASHKKPARPAYTIKAQCLGR